MDQEIGDSDKRVTTGGSAGDVTSQGRPIIGWLGIGMLGVAQICHEFKLISHYKRDRKAFRASIRLGDFRGEENIMFLKNKLQNNQLMLGNLRLNRLTTTRIR